MGARVHDVRDVNGIPSFFQVSWHFVTVVCVFHCLLFLSNIFSASLSLSETACGTGVVEINNLILISFATSLIFYLGLCPTVKTEIQIFTKKLKGPCMTGSLLLY